MNHIAPSPASGTPVAPVSNALQLASLRIAVFPLMPDTKLPYSNREVAAAVNRPEPPKGDGGLKFATTDPASIRAWWSRWPGAMIGVRTGTASGIVVLDVDRKNGKDGFATMDANAWTTPNTVVVQTPSGGAHYYFSIPRRADIRRAMYGDDIRILISDTLLHAAETYDRSLERRPRRRLARCP